MKPELLSRFTGFEWNEKKGKSNFRKHGIAFNEAQGAFYDKSSALVKIIREGLSEERYILIGKTDKGRLITVVLTIREPKIRIISARHPKPKEVKIYNSKS
jgi:uncharacterized protein